MKPIRLTAPYYFTHRDGRASTDAQLRIEAARERKDLVETRNWRNRANWRERFYRDPLANALAIDAAALELRVLAYYADACPMDVAGRPCPPTCLSTCAKEIA